MNCFETLLTGRSPEFLALIRAAQVVAATDVNVLLLGETGTGKDRLARAIHQASPRSGGAFVAVNCAALPEALAESLLFGHRKGAFTDAHRDQLGSIPAADGGSLFLDEVGELSLAVQAKLLRFIESGEVLPVGQSKSGKVNVRLVAATNRDLAAEVTAGRFRADLYYRLNVVPLELPPLRARDGDLEPLLTALTDELAGRHGLVAPSYSRAALQRLRRYPWPGNVRELRNFAERTLVLLPGREITPENLPVEMRQPAAVRSGAGFALPAGGISLEDLEVQMIRQALERTAGNRSRAARLLGLTRDTLLYRIKKYAL